MGTVALHPFPLLPHSPGREALHLCLPSEATIRTGQSDLSATLGLDPGLCILPGRCFNMWYILVRTPLYGLLPAVASPSVRQSLSELFKGTYSSSLQLC